MSSSVRLLLLSCLVCVVGACASAPSGMASQTATGTPETADQRILYALGQILARKLGDHLFGLLVYSQKPCSITAHKLTNQVQAVAPSASSMRREIYAIEHLCQVRFAGHLIPLISDPELS